MRRQEFIDDVTCWSDLIDFCYNEDIDLCEDVYNEERKDEYIDNHLDEICSDSTWQDVYRVLDDIPCGYEYYIIEDYYDIRPVEDSDFVHKKQEVLEWMTDNEYWDDEEEEEEPVYVDDDDYEEADEFEADTSVALDDFFASSADDLNKITSEAKATEAKANADFNKFTQRVTTVGDY